MVHNGRISKAFPSAGGRRWPLTLGDRSRLLFSRVATAQPESQRCCKINLEDHISFFQLYWILWSAVMDTLVKKLSIKMGGLSSGARNYVLIPFLLCVLLCGTLKFSCAMFSRDWTSVTSLFPDKCLWPHSPQLAMKIWAQSLLLES